MRKSLLIATLSLTAVLLILSAGCDKEKIVENTEYVHDIEYITLPPDTIIHFDTVLVDDSVVIHDTDTVLVLDTVIVNNVITVHDTVVVNHTIIDYDTVTVVQHHYDTVTVTQVAAGEATAFSALEANVNSLVIDFINGEFGYTDGWIFYLSIHQADITRQSATVYDLYGYIDYWTPDWSGYYPLEFGYRMTFTGNDPSDPNDWDISEAPATGSSQHPGGLRIAPVTTDARRPTN